MNKTIFQNIRPNDINKYVELSLDNSDYKNRLIAIDYFSKYNCYESKRELYRLMKSDKIFEVKEQAFRVLQNFGENVILRKKKKGKTIKKINEKLLILHNSFNGDDYSINDFKVSFKDKYPNIFDIYSYEKKGKLDDFILNSIKTFPQKKTKHNYSIRILLKETNIEISDEKLEIEHTNINEIKDELIINKNTITINCNRKAKINLNNIIFSEKNSIHNQIIKSLIYYYIKINAFVKIKSITIHRLTKTNDEIILALPNNGILIEQILNNKFSGVNVSSQSILDIFKNNDKANSIQFALTYLLKSKTTSEPSERFEKLWKSFNSIYYYFGNGLNENESQRLIRKFILENQQLFTNSLDNLKNITSQVLKEKVRFYELLANDYNTKEKIVSFIAFINRYQNSKICKNILDNLSYFEKDLKNIFTVDKIESKFNRFDNIKQIYNSNKKSSDTEIIYKEVKSYLQENVKNPKPNKEVEILVFICIKYCYYLRNKIFHAEKQDLTFRFAKNNLIIEIDWINNILESLIIELISANQQWIKNGT
ncbi:hypothetical protein [Tenacibaculum haliotis]|uniref:hypothetical protein n=1 Tax=Tenacibaculum haliotis TaxID=1888914 RepID=UPI0021AFAB6D|nr:hypothetical protein [Tenacibaculum haliotis]MCT4697624.1 hypothetical protein [Tenacibaculum haliotis]